MSFLNFSDGSFRSPLRESQSASNLARSPSSPFCTSPSQLQEVTLDQDGSFSNTMRSPTGAMRGRTVKEFEEQLTTLKKENFNLKLRIYFLEEKMGTNFTLDKDNVVKKNIELQVEMANLQKEVKEKHDLLCQAVKAMELEEEEHRKYAQKKENQFVELQQEVEELKLQMQMNVCKKNIEEANSSFDRSEMLRFQLDAVQRACDSKDQTVAQLNRELTSANERLSDFTNQIKEYEEKIERAHLQHETLVVKMQEQQKTMERLYSQLEATSQRYASAKTGLDDERKERERDKKAHVALSQRLDALHNDNRKLRDTIQDLQAKLEATVTEATKHQNLAVPEDSSNAPRYLTDHPHFISVPDAAAPDGTAQADAPHVPVGGASRAGGVRSPSTPDGRGFASFARLLAVEGGDVLRSEFESVKGEVSTMRRKIVKLKGEQLKACEIIKSMIELRNKSNEEIAQLKRAKAQLESELEGVVSKPANEGVARLMCQEAEEEAGTPPCENSRILSSQLDDMELTEQYKLLTEELEAKVEVLVATLKEKDAQMRALRTQYDDILNTLEEKENRIVDLEFELLSNQNSGKIDKSLLEKGDGNSSEKHSSFYKHELDEKNQEIERLNVELKKCTSYLQEIVNTELWEKNKEIEKLHRKQETTPEVVKLKKELSGKDLQLKLLKEKISELGLDIELPNNVDEVVSPKRNLEHIKGLQVQLKSAKEEKEFLASRLKESKALQETAERLKIENYNIKGELEKCERLRNETSEVCCILSARLEELAIFLDSLLKQKSVLGFLGLAKNKRLREIISNSLDMSRSFSMSLMGNPEQSLAQLSNITAFLNGSVFQELSIADDEPETHLSIIPDNISLTYESHIWKKPGTTQEEPDSERVISALREQVFNLKSELRLRDTELNRLNSNKITETEDDNDKLKCNPLKEKEAQSESEAWSEPDRAVSRARIGLNHSLPIMARTCNESTEDDDVCTDNTTPKKRSSVIELTQDICRLEKELERKSEEVIENSRVYQQKLHEFDLELQETRGKYSQAETEKINLEKKLDNLQKMVEDLSAYKTHCEASMIGKDKETQDKINTLELEKQSLLNQIQELERHLVDSKNDLLHAQQQLETVQTEMQSQAAILKREYEEGLVLKLKQAEETFSRQLRSVEEKCEAELKITQENMRLVKEEYSREYVKKSEVEKTLLEVEKFLGEISELKATVQSYEETIKSYKDKEREVKGVVQEYQNKLASLRAELDKTTLQHSEVVLEKTKLREDNQTLSRDIDVIGKKEQSLRSELVQIQNNLSDISQKYDQQVSTLHRQKNGLELRISELESSNAELHNRLIKMQTNRSGRPPCGRLPRQYSDEEEIRTGRPPIHPHDDAERAVANSSPDLGIESDHGRFSSLETNTNNIPRPLLQTIELTESMNNLFEEHQSRGNPPGNEHCCQKSLQIEQENNELKQKLLRMKRALEETAAQLSLANQRKKQVEKTICKQIHKTSQVLRKAKANLDSGSESDLLRTRD